MIPAKFTAGTTFSAVLTMTAYPAPDWVAQLILRGPQAIDLAAIAEGQQHRFAVAAGATSDWAPGAYWWQLRLSSAGEVIAADEGTLIVTADLAQVSGPHDGRGHVERVLGSIEAVIEGRATKDQERYTINNRELWRTPISDLLLLRDRYKAELRRQQQTKFGGQSLIGRNVKVRF